MNKRKNVKKESEWKKSHHEEGNTMLTNQKQAKRKWIIGTILSISIPFWIKQLVFLFIPLPFCAYQNWASFVGLSVSSVLRFIKSVWGTYPCGCPSLLLIIPKSSKYFSPTCEFKHVCTNVIKEKFKHIVILSRTLDLRIDYILHLKKQWGEGEVKP